MQNGNGARRLGPNDVSSFLKTTGMFELSVCTGIQFAGSQRRLQQKGAGRRSINGTN
jgi:hypothetical protein